MAEANLTPEANLKLQLGDIIEIEAPSDDSVNNKQFYIKYIDPTIIDLIAEDGNETQIAITETGSLRNEAITGINIINRADEPGYAKQNGLIPGVWVNIFFDDGDVPVVVTGKITNLEEDQIEITTHEDNEVIYIDFGYKGLPKNIPIQKIIIRETPPIKDRVEKEIDVEIPPQTPIQIETDVDEVLEVSVATVQPEEFKERIKDLILQANEIQFGETLDAVKQVVDLPDAEQRFGIEKQTNDLLDELLSTIPNAQRTQNVLNNVHLMIERFKQLRTEFSSFDNQGNALMPAIQGANFKPLVESLEKLNQKLYWILPVVRNKKKLYDIDADLGDEFSDVVPLTLAETRIAENTVVENYLQNDMPDEENKYAYLIKNTKQFLTPFTEPNHPDDSLSIQRVQTNITAVVNNLEDFKSSVAVNDDVKRRRFLIQEYNLGINTLETTKIKGGDIIVKVKNLTKPDTIVVKSLLTLPESAVSFSHINLPATNIMLKSNLNRNFLSYWKMLNKNTNLNTVIVDDLNKPVEHDENNFLTGITEFLSNEDDSTKGKYRDYLEAVIPKTKIMFNLVKKYIKGQLSVYDILKYMEPFMVYQKDISFQQYKEIIGFIQEKINQFKQNYVIKEREYSILAYGNSKRGVPTILKLLANDQALKNQVEEFYNLHKLPLNEMSNSELLRRVNKIDYARLFNTAIARIGVNLMFDDGFDKLTDMESYIKDFENKEKSEQEQEQSGREQSEQDSDCKRRVLSKKYIEIDELEDDNGFEIFFDKQYDKTYYDIAKEYQQELDAISGLIENKVEFLKNKLMENNGLSGEDALRDATAMIIGKRAVIDGDYAVVILENSEPPQSLYFKRRDNTWIRDLSINKNTFTDENKMFCNMSENCFEVKNQCQSLERSELELKNDNLKKVINEFDKNLIMSQDAIKNNIDVALQDALSRINYLITIEVNNQLKYNNEKYKMGLMAGEVIVESSPHEGLRDIILSQGDFIKRQSDISKFVNYYTRPAGETEDKWWLYCINTDIKLLPTFIAKLAQVFNNKDNYIYALQQVCREQGEISDDGDMWVDKYSGYTISNIDFDTEEGYTEQGYKVQSRERMVADLGDAIIQSNTSKKTFESPEANKITNVASAVSRFMGINIDNQLEFIVRSSVKMLGRSMPSKDAYEKAIAAAETKGKKKLDSYKKAFDSTLIIITLSYLLVAIQTSIPSIKTRKTHPGCKRSFTGYPMGGNEDKSALTYIACVADDIKSSIEPWNSIQKLNQKKLISKMETTIDKFIIQEAEVQDKFVEKINYLKISEDEDIPIEHDIKTWINFLPPLQPVKLKTFQNVTDEFQNQFINDLRSGNKAQYEKIDVLRSKIIYLSIGIEELIQKTVSKNVKAQNAILTNSNNEPFIENACCDNGSINTLQYFIDAEPEIKKYNAMVTSLRDLLDDVGTMGTAAILFDPTNTKRKFPELSNEFSEETVYRAFIVYCKYNSNIPVSDTLRAICMEKPDNFDIKDSIDEKIRKLQRDGRNYDNESLQQLMTIINRNNIVKLHLHNVAFNNVQVLRDILNSMNERNIKNVPVVFREKFLSMIDTFSIGGLMEDTPEMRDMKNYLDTTNKEMYTKIITFLNTNITINKRKAMREITECLDTLTTFNVTDDDETLFKMINFIKNALRTMTRVFPNIIINNVDYSNVNVPKHWKLSDKHNKDVQDIINKYYNPLNKFYNDTNLINLLNKAQFVTSDIEMLAQNTMFYAPVRVGDKYLYSVFDRRLITMLFKFYFNTVLLDYIGLVDDSELSRTAVVRPFLLEEFDTEITSQDNAFEAQIGDISQIDIVAGEKLLLSQKVSNMISTFMSIICKNKQEINYNYEQLMERILRAKEKEKNVITDYLKEMTDEEREIENLFKKNKLEKWGKGQEKGLRIYQAATYDDERDALEKQTLRDLKLNRMDQVNEMNQNIYNMENVMKEYEETQIEEEENNMAHIGEDNDNAGEEYDEEDY
jgi:hypothetical protein